MSSNGLIALKCKAMNYLWGKIGKESLVFKYLENGGETNLDQNLPFAELWMGDHPNAPSLTPDGKRICEVTDELPFLFKVLSVNEPLSLQCHPDLNNAKILHAKDPKNYPDANHKPECGFFLTKTSILYGIREYQEIVQFLNKIPEFKALVSEQIVKNFIDNPSEEMFKEFLRALLSLKYDQFAEKAESFIKNYKNYNLDQTVSHGIELIVKYFPKDIGIFLPFILNVVMCEPGQCLLISTGTLHAYIEGDLVEAMALSDNVIRAAMTPKFVDVESLFKVMTFKPQGPHFLNPKSEQPGLNYFSTGYDSFNLTSGNVPKGKSITVPAKKAASIVSFINGSGKINNESFHSGNTFLILPNIELNIVAENDVELYICSSQ